MLRQYNHGNLTLGNFSQKVILNNLKSLEFKSASRIVICQHNYGFGFMLSQEMFTLSLQSILKRVTDSQRNQGLSQFGPAWVTSQSHANTKLYLFFFSFLPLPKGILLKSLQFFNHCRNIMCKPNLIQKTNLCIKSKSSCSGPQNQ